LLSKASEPEIGTTAQKRSYKTALHPAPGITQLSLLVGTAIDKVISGA
jgi:hypothetical protein